MTENEIAKQVVDISYKIYRSLGSGLLESVYETVLAYELRKLGLQVDCQQPVPVVYEDVRMEIGFRADLIIDGKVIIELKSIDALNDAHKKQLLTYLKLTNIKLGLLINFGGETFKGNVVRIANGLDQPT